MSPRHGSRTRRRILEVIETDTSFERVELREGAGYEGRCIHYQAKLHVLHDGTPVGDVTIEHIIPKSRGGTDDLRNLALACGRCNHQKGIRHDGRVATDRALEVEAALLKRRQERWRPPEEAEVVPLPYDGELDLHTFSPADVGRLLPAYFEECQQRGVLVVRLIHGKGTGALRRSVHAILQRMPELVARFEQAEEKDGGWGSTWVHLRSRT